MAHIPPGFGPLLRQWRQSRAFSQEQLAEQSEISPRHLSFLETGRSAPSREMVLILGNALDMPLRERNALLAAAGFAPVYSAFDLEEPAMLPVRTALERILRAQEPHAAVVLDRSWNLVRVNEGAVRLLATFADPRGASELVQRNLVHALLHPTYLRPSIVNWNDVASSMVERLRREAVLDAQAEALLREVLEYPEVGERSVRVAIERLPVVALDVHLRRGSIDVRFFTTLTTLGTPLDVTAQELRIESYFPADDATDAWMRGADAS